MPTLRPPFRQDLPPARAFHAGTESVHFSAAAPIRLKRSLGHSLSPLLAGTTSRIVSPRTLSQKHSVYQSFGEGVKHAAGQSGCRCQVKMSYSLPSRNVLLTESPWRGEQTRTATDDTFTPASTSGSWRASCIPTTRPHKDAGSRFIRTTSTGGRWKSWRPRRGRSNAPAANSPRSSATKPTTSKTMPSGWVTQSFGGSICLWARQ